MVVNYRQHLPTPASSSPRRLLPLPRCPHPPGASQCRRSDGPLSHPSEIYGARTRYMEVMRQCCKGVGGSPPTRSGALSHPGDWAPPTPTGHGVPRLYPTPSPPSQARYWWRWWQWCSRVSARRRLQPQRSESIGPVFSSPMLHMYVSSVSVVSDVCCNCFI
jgi:hypothetical protein